MPSSEEILKLLAEMSRELEWLAIGWHLAIFIAAVAIVAGWRPRAPMAIGMLVTPAASVSVAAIAYGNPFNGISFALLAIILVVLSARNPKANVEVTRGDLALGVALILYATCYPHFVDGPVYRALYAAPVGIVPCPTLALLAGVTLMSGFGSARLRAVLAIWSAFYAMVGIFVLGVWLDAGLLVATLALVSHGRSRAARASSRSRSWIHVRRP